MTDIEKLVEECARAILIADGVKYVKRDAEWEADVTRHTLQRLDSFIAGMAGKRLTYAGLIA